MRTLWAIVCGFFSRAGWGAFLGAFVRGFLAVFRGIYNWIRQSIRGHSDFWAYVEELNRTVFAPVIEPEYTIRRVFYPRTGCNVPHYQVTEQEWHASIIEWQIEALNWLKDYKEDVEEDE